MEAVDEKLAQGSSPPGPRRSRRALGRRRRRLHWTIALLVTGALLATGLGIVLYRATRPRVYLPGEELLEITRVLSKSLPGDAPLPHFQDVTAEAGLDSFRTFTGGRSSQLPEDMGSGAAWGDFDNDGDEDLFLVSAGGALSLSPAERAPSELYENLGDGTFHRLETFPETRIIGMAAAWGDYNEDGWLDLIVTGYRSLILYRNEAGRFVRDRRFPEAEGFWAGAAWGDFDNDLDLDLYVCGYVRYLEMDASQAHASLQYGRSVPYTLNPASYQPERNLLFRNEGDGTFTEVAEVLQVANPDGRSLGALWHDFDDDGWLDLYVANDISDNVFYRNRQGRFEEISHSAWIADYRGAMGITAGDWNRDGDDDLFITHWVAQENALYDSLFGSWPAISPEGATPGRETSLGPTAPPTVRGTLRFLDVADQRGLGQIALRFVGWGTEFADFDGDGWLDLIVANGGTFETEKTPKGLQPQEAFLFWNRSGDHFYDLAPLNEAFSMPHVGRGLALADFDNDGDMDILLMHHGEGAQLLRNEMQTGNWLKVRLRSQVGRSKKARGFGDGAKLVAHSKGIVLRRTVGSSSYLSQSSRIVHFGLGEAMGVEKLDVNWRGNESMVYTDLDGGTMWELIEGDPKPRRVAPYGIARPVDDHSIPSSSPPSRDERALLVEFWEKQRAATNAMKVEKNLPLAITLFRETLTLNPAHEDSLYYLANCLVQQGDLPGAMEQLEQLVHINPQSHRGYMLMGTLRAMLASSPLDLDAAEEILEKALSINPEETGALLILGEIALIRGELQTAEQRLAWVCRTNPRAVGGFYLRGYLAWKQGDPALARDLLGKARKALGPDGKPTGTTSEGDVHHKMYTDETPLSRFWKQWDGSLDPTKAFAPLEVHLRKNSRESPLDTQP